MKLVFIALTCLLLACGGSRVRVPVAVLDSIIGERIAEYDSVRMDNVRKLFMVMDSVRARNDSILAVSILILSEKVKDGRNTGTR